MPLLNFIYSPMELLTCKKEPFWKEVSVESQMTNRAHIEYQMTIRAHVEYQMTIRAHGLLAKKCKKCQFIDNEIWKTWKCIKEEKFFFCVRVRKKRYDIIIKFIFLLLSLLAVSETLPYFKTFWYFACIAIDQCFLPLY